MIVLQLATQKYPAALNAAVALLRRRLPSLSRSLSSVKAQAAVARRMKRLSQVRIDVHIIGDAAMKKMNAQYRKKPVTTDVLAFSYFETGNPVFAHETAGEIYISAQRAKAQARENAIAPADELALLTVHGALHILGYDHEKSAQQKRKMRDAETQVLTANGINGALTGR